MNKQISPVTLSNLERVLENWPQRLGDSVEELLHVA